MNIYENMTTRAGSPLFCRKCKAPAQVRARCGGVVWCLDCYKVELSKSCGIYKTLRTETDSIPIIGQWIIAAILQAYVETHIRSHCP